MREKRWCATAVRRRRVRWSAARHSVGLRRRESWCERRRGKP